MRISKRNTYFCPQKTVMLDLLLYIQTTNPYFLPFIWVVGLLVAVLLCAGIVIQRRTTKAIQSELGELEKARAGNIEYEFVIKAMKIATWHMDVKRRVISYDADYREGKESYTTTPETPVSLMWDYLESSDSERVKAALEELALGYTNFYHQIYRVKMGSSNKMYWEESYATIAARDDEGRPLKIVGTSMRIDEQKEMEMALISARNKAEESDRLKTAFLANMGHEIRTPLNAIVGFADLLPVVDNEADRNQLIEEIRNNNHKLLQIIDGLVSMSKVEAEAKSLVKSQTNIVPLLKQISDKYAQLLDGQVVSMIDQFPYPELMITTDAGKLTEIVEKLMENAVKFTQKGNITLGFELTHGDHVRIFVKDTGKGIQSADQQRIFERFVKLDEYIPGTGLGLTVVKSHVESLGGTCGVDSTPGVGSTFWFKLPMA